MKKHFVRAALVAGLSLLVCGTTFVAAPAADKATISRSISKPMGEAQKALQAKDWATALTNLKAAQATPDLTDFDKYIIDRYLGIAYLGTNDRPNAEKVIVEAAQSPALPDNERTTVMQAAIGLANEVNDFQTVIKMGQVAEKANVLDAVMAMIVASAYDQINDFQNAVKYAQKSIDMSKAQGKLPDRRVYEVLVFAQNHMKDEAGQYKTFETLATDYGDPDDWGHLIDLTLGMLSSSNKAYRDIAALDVYRLRLMAGATSSAEDYLAMADAALSLRSPGDAQQALEKGKEKGTLTGSRGAAMLAKANADAKKDRPVLPQAEAAAAKAGSAAEEASVAEAYFGYGEYADAARVAQHAIAKGGAKAAEMKLVLGMSQVMQNDNTAAAQTLATVDGDPSLDRAAHLWSLYATRKYGTAAAAAAH